MEDVTRTKEELRERFIRRADTVMTVLVRAWLPSLPVLGICGIWWHVLWIVLAAETVFLLLVATDFAYDSRWKPHA